MPILFATIYGEVKVEQDIQKWWRYLQMNWKSEHAKLWRVNYVIVGGPETTHVICTPQLCVSGVVNGWSNYFRAETSAWAVNSLDFLKIVTADIPVLSGLLSQKRSVDIKGSSLCFWNVFFINIWHYAIMPQSFKMLLYSDQRKSSFFSFVFTNYFISCMWRTFKK